MSSPKAAVAARPRKPARRARTVTLAPTEPASPPATAASDDAKGLAAEIEKGLADGRLDTLSPEAFQTLMSALCRLYGARSEAGSQDLPLKERAGGVANTDVMLMASALLRSANLAVFELGMWQSWTGR